VEKKDTATATLLFKQAPDTNQFTLSGRLHDWMVAKT